MAMIPMEYDGGGIRFPDLSKSPIYSFAYDNQEHTWNATEDCWVFGRCYIEPTSAAGATNYFALINSSSSSVYVACVIPSSCMQGVCFPVKKGQTVSWKNYGYACVAYPMINN